MFVRWLLFNTKVGDLLLAFLERRIGLAVVDAKWLGVQRTGMAADLIEAQ